MMIGRNTLAKARQRFYDVWEYLARVPERMRLRSNDLNGVDQLEGRMQMALPPVKPPTDFRQRLRDNLELAAQRKTSGLMIEYPKPFRESIILGISAGILTTVVTILVLVFFSRRSSAEN